jgi:hypothetical protein
LANSAPVDRIANALKDALGAEELTPVARMPSIKPW